MTARRALLLILPVFFVLSIVSFFILHYQEQAYQAERQKGWSIYLDEFQIGNMGGSLGTRDGDMLIDPRGQIWVAGGGVGLHDLQMFDGTKWISHKLGASDLAVAPNGEIWTAVGDGLAVYDGQEWTIYKNVLGSEIHQVEIDSNGRIWVSADYFGTDVVAEIIINKRDAPSISAEFQFTMDNGAIRSLDADETGRTWAALSVYQNDDSRDTDKLLIFDGDTWQQIYRDEMPIEGVVRTSFDRRGQIWVATECGGVMMYSKGNWTSIVDENPDCSYSSQGLAGITVDHQDRIWVWNSKKVQYLDGDSWITLTPENSGMFESDEFAWIFGVVVDKQDRVWVASSRGVSMAAVKDAKPLPERVVSLHRVYKDRLIGISWFLPSLIAAVWLAVFFDVWPGVLLASVLGLLLALGIGKRDEYHPSSYFTTFAAFITLLGMLGGVTGSLIGRRKSIAKSRGLAIGLALVGMVAGLVITLCLLLTVFAY